MKRKKTVIMLIIIYLILAFPFKALEIIPGFTDVRPVNMLVPVFGIFFGIPGCLVFVFGNLFMDFVSDSIRWSSIAGLIANFVGPYFIYKYYNKISKKPFSLRKGREILTFLLISFIAAVLEAAIITPSVAIIYPEVDAKLFALTVVANTFIFPVLFGMPIIMLMHNELGFKIFKDREKDKQEVS